MTRPGLVVDLARRVDAPRLALCFSKVRPLGQMIRSAPTRPYAVFLVAGPRTDLVRQGCPAVAEERD
jgi:hypothetical protein